MVFNEYRPQIAVIGAGSCDEETAALAERVGELLALRGAVLFCGGLGGVMEAAARGACKRGGLTVGILPGPVSGGANSYMQVRVATNLGHARNVLLAHSADALVAVAGEYGTLSEIAIALKLGKPVVALDSWRISDDLLPAATPEEAVDKVFTALASGAAVGGALKKSLNVDFSKYP